MAKPTPKPETQENRKHESRRQRDAQANRIVLIILGAVAVLVVLLVAAGAGSELIVKPRRPVAIVNDQPITTADYQKQVKFAWYQQSQQQQGLDDPQGVGIQVLDEMVDVALLKGQAAERGITVTQDEVSEAIETLYGYARIPPTVAPMPTPDPAATPGTEPTPTPLPTPTPVTLESYQKSYNAYLERISTVAGMSEADFRAIIERDLLRQKLYEAISAETPKTAEQVKASHILVAIREPAPTPVPTATGGPTPDPAATPAPTPQPTLAPRDDAQALARITEVQQKVAAGGDFAALAAEYSDDPGSAAQGGDLGWFARDQGLVKEFEDAAFALQAGQLSQPVKTQFGYHLIKVLERDPARELDPYFLQQKQSQAYQDLLTRLRDAGRVERRWTVDSLPATPGAAQN
jgi:parvulin-like peptidyl-prolyl isomerase